MAIEYIPGCDHVIMPELVRIPKDRRVYTSMGGINRGLLKQTRLYAVRVPTIKLSFVFLDNIILKSLQPLNHFEMHFIGLKINNSFLGNQSKKAFSHLFWIFK